MEVSMEMGWQERHHIQGLTSQLLKFGEVLPDELTSHLRTVWEELEEIAHEEWADSHVFYISVAGELEGRIARGELAPGKPLPIQRELAREFGFSEATIRRAIRQLANRNLVCHKGGRIVVTTTARDLAKPLHRTRPPERPNLRIVHSVGMIPSAVLA